MEELGAGGMGKVYKVFDNKIQEVVALKLVRPELASRPQTLDRFREEIRLARKITHKNVCRMHDINEAEKVSYITMEYIPGEDLKSIIRMMGRLSPGQAIAVAKQVCSGLAEAHKMGIVHRDLKPKNIMVDRQGKARIMDFGLARSLEEKGITGGRVMLGTAEYMSPEQVDGKKADSRSDIYSLGVIIFEMVTGTIPFEGDSALSIAVKHKTEPPPDPREINGQVPETLSRIILKCLEKKEEKRFQSTEELCSELEKLEKTLPTEEKILPKKRPSTLEKLVRHPLLRKIAFPVLAVMMAVLLSILAWRLFAKKTAVVSPAAKPSLAVLFFKNNTGDRDLDVWKEALAENLIWEFRRSSDDIIVLSADTVRSVFRKLGLSQTGSYSSEDLLAVGKETGANHILIGTFSKTRIYYDLKDARTNELMSSGRADGEGEKDYDRMTDDLAGQVLAGFSLSAKAQAAKISTASIYANRYYQLGRQAEKKYKDNKNDEAFGESLAFYEKAIAEDPGFALIYWGLGDLYQSRYVTTEDPRDFRLTLGYYEKAYEIAPDLAGANSGLGWAHFLKGDNEKAFFYFRRSLELEPVNPSIHFNIASFFRSIGLLEEAVKHYNQAIDLGEPSFMTHWLRVRCLERLGKTEEAVAAARQLLESEPDNIGAALLYGRMLISQKRLPEAEREIAFAAKLDPGSLDLRLSQALFFAARGDREKALPLVEPARERPVYYSYLLSRVFALLGMKNEALENIKLGIERGFQETREYLFEYPFLASSHFYDRLRADPRFIQILEKQKIRHDENLRKFGGL
jgi:serine/threonine protein kinase/Flp pilus assembly protein TadD